MTRIFYGFVVAGMVLIILAAAVFPLPASPRYRSAISVIPDGGREESFTIQWPQDRMQPIKAPGSGALVLAGGAAVLAGADGEAASAEIFRLRDMAGDIIGLASRSTGTRRRNEETVGRGSDWVLMIPSRGNLFLTQLDSRDVAPRRPDAGGKFVPARDDAAFWSQATRLVVTAGPGPGGAGRVIGGTQEFADLHGTYDETWELEEVTADGSTRGRITLTTRVQEAVD